LHIDDHANTPPAHALANRQINENVTGYTVYGDYSEANSAARIIDAVAAGEVDVAIVWGPSADYFAPRQPVPPAVVSVSPQIDPPALSFAFDISIGVRRGDEAFRGELEEMLARKRPEIEAVLDAYGVPQVAVAPLRVVP
jgi:mxaJ protein